VCGRGPMRDKSEGKADGTTHGGAQKRVDAIFDANLEEDEDQKENPRWHGSEKKHNAQPAKLGPKG